MQSPESLPGKDLPLSSPKPFRLQTQERPLESIKGSCKCLPRLTVSQHLLSPPCLVKQYRHEQDSGERRLPPWETLGVKKERKSQELQPVSPRFKHQGKPEQQKTCFPPKHEFGIHSCGATGDARAEGTSPGSAASRLKCLWQRKNQP